MVGMQGRASMQSADSASGSGEGDAKGLVPPQHAQVDSKAASELTETCAKCRPCCRGTASEGEWPSPVESPVRMLSDAAASPPSEAFTFSMPSTLAARSSAVEPESRPSGANVDDGANGPESALCADQSSDLGLSSGGLSHELEAVVPQSRNSPAGIFRDTHAGQAPSAARACAADQHLFGTSSTCKKDEREGRRVQGDCQRIFEHSALWLFRYHPSAKFCGSSAPNQVRATAVLVQPCELSPMEAAEEFWAAEELREAEEAAKLRLLQEQLAGLPGAASAASWTLEQLAELEALIRRQKGVCEERDVGLLSEVKRWFKQAGMPRLDPREAVVKAVQARLWPN